MKTRIALLITSLIGVVSVAHSAVLLTVDIANASSGSITISATGLASSSDVSGLTLADGITLVDFFTGTVNAEGGGYLLSTSALRPAGNSLDPAFNETALSSSETPFGVSSMQDLEIYLASESTTPDSIFINGSAAFSGTLVTTDFFIYDGGSVVTNNTIVLSFLPSVGTVGSINAGWADAPGPVIGQWQIINSMSVPEPAMAAAFAGLFVFVVCATRRRSRN